MTEAEWLACEDPSVFLNLHPGSISERKIQLFVLACCRCDQKLLKSVSFQNAITVADLFTEGLATKEMLDSEHRRINEYACSIAGLSQGKTEEQTLEWASACAVAGTLRCDGLETVWGLDRASDVNLRPRFTRIFKDIVRNPFRPIAFGTPWFDLVKCPSVPLPFFPTSADPAWRTPKVLALANGIYADRAYDRMPMLADALEEAGCDNVDILLHCREPGEHVRGCWVVDLVLGKE